MSTIDTNVFLKGFHKQAKELGADPHFLQGQMSEYEKLAQEFEETFDALQTTDPEVRVKVAEAIMKQADLQQILSSLGNGFQSASQATGNAVGGTGTTGAGILGGGGGALIGLLLSKMFGLPPMLGTALAAALGYGGYRAGTGQFNKMFDQQSGAFDDALDNPATQTGAPAPVPTAPIPGAPNPQAPQIDAPAAIQPPPQMTPPAVTPPTPIAPPPPMAAPPALPETPPLPPGFPGASQPQSLLTPQQAPSLLGDGNGDPTGYEQFKQDLGAAQQQDSLTKMLGQGNFRDYMNGKVELPQKPEGVIPAVQHGMQRGTGNTSVTNLRVPPANQNMMPAPPKPPSLLSPLDEATGGQQQPGTPIKSPGMTQGSPAGQPGKMNPSAAMKPTLPGQPANIAKGFDIQNKMRIGKI